MGATVFISKKSHQPYNRNNKLMKRKWNYKPHSFNGVFSLAYRATNIPHYLVPRHKGGEEFNNKDKCLKRDKCFKKKLVEKGKICKKKKIKRRWDKITSHFRY